MDLEIKGDSPICVLVTIVTGAVLPNGECTWALSFSGLYGTSEPDQVHVLLLDKGCIVTIQSASLVPDLTDGWEGNSGLLQYRFTRPASYQLPNEV